MLEVLEPRASLGGCDIDPQPYTRENWLEVVLEWPDLLKADTLNDPGLYHQWLGQYSLTN